MTMLQPLSVPRVVDPRLGLEVCYGCNGFAPGRTVVVSGVPLWCRDCRRAAEILHAKVMG